MQNALTELVHYSVYRHMDAVDGMVAGLSVNVTPSWFNCPEYLMLTSHGQRLNFQRRCTRCHGSSVHSLYAYSQWRHSTLGVLCFLTEK